MYVINSVEREKKNLIMTGNLQLSRRALLPGIYKYIYYIYIYVHFKILFFFFGAFDKQNILLRQRHRYAGSRVFFVKGRGDSEDQKKGGGVGDNYSACGPEEMCYVSTCCFVTVYCTYCTAI